MENAPRKKVYLISGLGGDERVFSFLDLSFADPVFVPWIRPEKRESLEGYALRLARTIPDPAPVIIGVSFGGMLATEIVKANPAARAILISSNKTAKEFPSYWRVGKYIPLYRWLPGAMAGRLAYGVKWIMGRNGPAQKKLLLEIIREMDIRFVRWAIYAILHWKNQTIPANLVHIHGTNDRLLPHRLVKADFLIKGGNHVMVMDSATEISALLRQLLA